MKTIGAMVPLALWAATLVAPPSAVAQDPCPSASAADAEAGWAAYQDGELAEARARLTSALERCDNDQYARTGLAYVELREDGTARAATLFDEVVRAEPGNVDALVGLGLVHWRMGDLEAVRDYFGRTLEYVPDHPTALEYLDRLDGDRAAPADEADEAWTSGDVERARRLYEARLREDPDDGVALTRLALAHGWEGEYDEGLALLDRLVGEDPGNLEARLVRARLVAWSGDVGAATAAVQAILAVEPDNAAALEALALFRSWSGESEGAVEIYDQLLTFSPGHAGARADQARALAWSEDYEQALASYEALVAESPDEVEPRLGLARARAFSGDLSGAIADYDAVLNIAPDEVRASVGKARTLGWSGQLVAAERVARDAVVRHGENGEAWGVLGEIYRWQGRTGAAKETLARAATLAPSDAAIRDQLRSVDLVLSPRARPSVRGEDDSDGNRMITATLAGSVYATPRLQIRAEGYRRDLEQELSLGVIERSALGASVEATYELDPGWRLTGGVGGSATDGFEDPTFLSYRLGVRSPQRRGYDASIELTSSGVHETAAMAERGVRQTQLFVSGRWRPDGDWRVAAQVGIGEYEATESNGRRSLLLTASRSVGSTLTLGAGLRGFSFERNLQDGYFDPEFYGIAEIRGTWLHRPLPWTFLVEVAPGVQQVTTEGDPGAAFRGNGRVAYRVGGASEVSLGVSYSTASVTTFASGAQGYDYVSLVLGVNWVL